MHIQRLLAVLLAALLTTSAWAQTSAKPLNWNHPLTCPLPTAASLPAGPVSSVPGVYYGDTSSRMSNTRVEGAARKTCDDSTYDKPQAHGSVGQGVVGGTYRTGSVSVSKAFGSYDEPPAGVNFSIGTGTGNYHRRGN